MFIPPFSCSRFGTLARSQFCWHKLGQFWVRLKHNYMSHESSKNHPILFRALGLQRYARLALSHVFRETRKLCCRKQTDDADDTHNSSHGIQAGQLRWAVLPGCHEHICVKLKTQPNLPAGKSKYGTTPFECCWSPKSMFGRFYILIYFRVV